MKIASHRIRDLRESPPDLFETRRGSGIPYSRSQAFKDPVVEGQAPTKMEVLQRQVYGFRNFKTIVLRVKTMCNVEIDQRRGGCPH